MRASSTGSGAVPRHRVGDDHQQRNISACKRGRLRQQAWHLPRTMWRHDIVPKAIIYNATIRVRRGPTAPAGFHLLRAVQRHAIGPEVFTSNAASVRVKRAGCISRPGTSYD